MIRFTNGIPYGSLHRLFFFGTYASTLRQCNAFRCCTIRFDIFNLLPSVKFISAFLCNASSTSSISYLCAHAKGNLLALEPVKDSTPRTLTKHPFPSRPPFNHRCTKVPIIISAVRITKIRCGRDGSNQNAESPTALPIAFGPHSDVLC